LSFSLKAFAFVLTFGLTTLMLINKLIALRAKNCVLTFYAKNCVLTFYAKKHGFSF